MLSFATISVLAVLSFIGGFYAGVKNANSKKVSIAKDLIDKYNK